MYEQATSTLRIQNYMKRCTAMTSMELYLKTDQSWQIFKSQNLSVPNLKLVKNKARLAILYFENLIHNLVSRCPLV